MNAESKPKDKPKTEQLQMWTIQQMADFLQVHAWTVRQWVANKDCPDAFRDPGRACRPCARSDHPRGGGVNARLQEAVPQTPPQVAVVVLGVGQVGQDNAGHATHPEALRGRQPAVSGNDGVRFVDQNGVVEPELLD